MYDWWVSLLLGIVEGVTEFLPVSSTGHLLIVSKLFHFSASAGGTFEIVIQLGAILAVIHYYGSELLDQARNVRHDPTVRQFWLAIILAFMPAAIVGLAFHRQIKQVLFASPTIIAWALILGGIVLILVERLPQRHSIDHVMHITFRKALVVGLAQMLSLIPGVSRAGSAIVGGLGAGLSRRLATQFSFYLAIPTIGAATLFDLVTSLDELRDQNLALLAVGMVTSAVVAWLSIRWLLRYVASHSFVAFGIYRIVAGGLILALQATGALSG
jgi:undecaprenyl-diphosphatase